MVIRTEKDRDLAEDMVIICECTEEFIYERILVFDS